MCFILLTMIYLALPRVYKMKDNTILDTEGVVKNGINSVHRGAKRLDIIGWAYKQGQDVKCFKNYFVLENKETGKKYLLNTAMQEIPELERVEEQYDCSNGGMHAQSIVLGIDDGSYELYVLYQSDDENILSDTGIVIEI